MMSIISFNVINNMYLVDRIEKLLKKEGSMQLIEIVNELNKDPSYGKVTRNTINTTLYNHKDKFKRVSYGVYDLKNGTVKQIESSVLDKVLVLMVIYQKIMRSNNVSFDTKIKFSKEEISFISRRFSKIKTDGEYRL